MPSEAYECPSCGAAVDAAARECPKCGEIFDASVLQGDETVRSSRKASRKGRMLFYIGIGLVLAGGPAIALGSWLHDLLRIPVVGDAYDTFGWVNRFTAAIGLVLLVVGIVMLILSMRLGSAEFDEDYDIGTPRNT